MAPAELATPLPADLDSVSAAAIPTNSTTVFVALEETANLRRGESVLVHATANGFGPQMDQATRLLETDRVVGIIRSRARRQEAPGLGYDEVWLTESLAEADPAQFDIVADPMAGPAQLRSLDLLRMGERFLVLGDTSQKQD